MLIICLIILITLIIFYYLITKKVSNNINNNKEKIFTLAELKKYNGRNKEVNKQVYISFKNVVFDVSHVQFYKANQAYNIFAGTDCTVALSTMKQNEELLNVDYKTYNFEQKEIKTMDNWYQRFMEKYPIKGTLILNK